MATTAKVGERAFDNANTARAVVEAHGSEERRQRLATYYSPAPAPTNKPVEFAAYQSDLLAGLSEIITDLHARVVALETPVAAIATEVTATEAEPAPKRGRPKKADA